MVAVAWTGQDLIIATAGRERVLGPLASPLAANQPACSGLRSSLTAEGKIIDVVIQFYRVRLADGAQAMVGREIAAASDLDNAIEIARHLGQTLDMPQRSDTMTISDSEGNELYSGLFDDAGTSS